MQPRPAFNRTSLSWNTLWIAAQLFHRYTHSADVTADVDSIRSAIKSQRNMVTLVLCGSNAKKFANTDVYRRRAELMQLLHPEEREGKEPALGHSKSGASVLIRMESATSSVFLLPDLYKECGVFLPFHVSI